MGRVFVETEVLQKVYEEVRRRFREIDDLAHGWEHVERVYKLALYIADQEGAEHFIVGAAALMHDLGRTERHSEDAHHADLSVVLASKILKEQSVPLEKQEAILHAIVAHSFSKGVVPQTVEAGIVRDADRLDGLGAIGILRWAITGTMRSTPQTRSYHPEDPFAQARQLDDKQYMLDHFYAKLLKLSDTMITHTGRQLAHERTELMHTYLEAFQHEVEFL